MDMDDRALMDSEIFRAFALQEARRKQAEEDAKDPVKDHIATVSEKIKVANEWKDFEEKVNASSYLKSYFKKARATLEEYPELRKQVDKKFLYALDNLSLEQE